MVPIQTLVVAATLEHAEGLAADLATLLPGDAVLLFPEQESLPSDKKSPYKGLVGQQVEGLHRLLQGAPCVVVTSAKGLKWKVLPPGEIRTHTLHLRCGEDLDLDSMLARLGEMGYYSVPRAESPGDFARKGGILDVFSVSYENPVRLELLGDTIESIRFFDATTQRSLEETHAALVPPCSPLILSDDNVARAVASSRCRWAPASTTTSATFWSTTVTAWIPPTPNGPAPITPTCVAPATTNDHHHPKDTDHARTQHPRSAARAQAARIRRCPR